MRIDQFDALGELAIDFVFAVKDQELSGFQPAFKIATVKKFAGKRESVFILHQQMVDGVAATHAANRSAAADADFQGIDAARPHVLDRREMDAVFVAEWQIS